MKTAALFLAKLLVVVCVLSVMPARAATYVVRPDGSGDFPTIQAALDAAVGGDEILLASGTFLGAGNHDLTFRGKSIGLRSESGNPATCIIDGEYRGGGFQFISAETRAARIEGVTVARGRADSGWGGGAYISQSAPTFVNCVFDDCYGDLGGGIFVDRGSPLILGCTFTRCGHVFGLYSGGGAIYARVSDLRIEDCWFEGNLSPEGGAIWALGTNLHVLRSTFVGNIGGGAALWCESGSVVQLTSCTLNFNLWDDAQIRLLGGSSLQADHTLIAFGDLDQETAILCDASSTATLRCSCVFGHPGGDWIGCLAGQDAMNDNLWVDPIICSHDDLDPYLRSDSPCAAENNPACGQIGSLGVGCDGPVPVRVTTWGQIKAGYR